MGWREAKRALFRTGKSNTFAAAAAAAHLPKGDSLLNARASAQKTAQTGRRKVETRRAGPAESPSRGAIPLSLALTLVAPSQPELHGVGMDCGCHFAHQINGTSTCE
ncbi:hypothetical protein L1887_47029 [Cichorium endivia]|nr:hypothetical protein L1887_47029 [Cichorium endivia]